MIHNPLKRAILTILKEAKQPIKEYELHTMLGGLAFSQFTRNCSAELVLFRKHFLVMNALYTLHDELFKQGLYLQISALNIIIKKMNGGQNKAHALHTDCTFRKLSHYYQNWNNFDKTSEQEVNTLLNTFWKHFLLHDEKHQSLASLELAENSNWTDIQKKYKQLCQQHHPDKGGNAVYFLEIRQAYDNLKCIYKTY